MLSTSCASDLPPAPGGISPSLRPLLLPQLVQDRKSRMLEERIVGLEGCDLTYVYYTTNSSSSDVASPVTPTFSTRGGHLRYSSSASSLELPPLVTQEGPTSPTQQHVATKSSIRQLPDVQEEPLELEREDEDDMSDSFGLYSCLCDQACEHRDSSDVLPPDVLSEYDIDYDQGFMSDSDFTADPRYPRKKRVMSGESTLMALTSRFGSRFPGITRWKSARRANVMTSPTTQLSLENVLSGAPSSRSSSMSAPIRQFPDRIQEVHMPPNPAMPFYESSDSLDMRDISREERSSIERDRSMATTPLLPPLMTDPLGKPPQPSPLQSPSIMPSPAAMEIHSPRLPPAQLPRQSLSSKPSVSSLRQVAVMAELPLPLPPSIVQEQDEWSDRLGHANFTITPMPYELQIINAETVTKFHDDWDAARVNYTKHLVRTGDNYGQTSKIYALTEAKWAEIERKWKATYDRIIRQTEPAAPAMMASRSRSRGRGRGRTESLSAAYKSHRSQDDVFAAVQWRRMDDCLPSAVPQMLEALDAEGKFPGRGDEDIVGPMQRDEFMIRARSEETKTRFWKHLAEKLRR